MVSLTGHETVNGYVGNEMLANRGLALKEVCSTLVFAAFVASGLKAGEPAHEAQDWPQGRVLTWANPGSGGDLLKPANWLEDGKPAKAGPDKSTDLVLPDAPQPYMVSGAARAVGFGRDQGLAIRHITVGRGAGLDVGYKSGLENWVGILTIHGDVEIREGGYLYGDIRLVGDKHTVFRIDPKASEPLVYNLNVGKADNASVTLFCRSFGSALGIEVLSGRLIVGSDSILRCNMDQTVRVKAGKLGRTASNLPLNWDTRRRAMREPEERR